jgi:putative ABC transport system ATP-binding protein
MSEKMPEYSVSQVFQLLRNMLKNEKQYYWLAVIYGIGISLLTLAVPISVQMLINTVANTGLVAQLVVLTVTLFVLLMISGLLYALRLHLMELFGRRFYARLVGEITLRTIYSQNPFFMDNNKSTLFNRYFDIVIVQKTVPYLLIGGFSIILQALVGFVIVSLYHPVFLGFNIVLIIMLWLVWAIWGKGAILSAVELSHTKHNVAGWVEGLGASNGYYKSRQHIERSLMETDRHTSNYIKSSEKHFKYTFSQTLAFLFIYALASALLLGTGGWLVIIGELSLGQLVAAELILSAVFYGISQLGMYLSNFYDLAAATEELSHFYDVPQEIPEGNIEPRQGDGDLIFSNVQGIARSVEVIFNFKIEKGKRIMCATPNHGVQRLFTDLLKHHIKPDGGYVTFFGTDILDIEVHELRQIITILDRPTLVAATIREYLRYADVNQPSNLMMEALECVGLDETIRYLPEGMDTKLSVTGAPFSLVEVLKLKLAAALISKPNILVLNQLFDVVPSHILKRVIDKINNNGETTIMYFSNRDDSLNFNNFLLFDDHKQMYFENFQKFKFENLKLSNQLTEEKD